MSEQTKSPSHIASDEIVNELTKNLQDSLNAENPGQFVINPESGTAGKPPDAGDAAFTDIPLSEPDLGKDEKDQEESDTDSINEESLKDAEVDLTDDQKEERKVIAEELKESGNFAFKVGDYDLSIEKYTSGLQTCPLQFSQLRAILYSNRSAAKMKQQKYVRAIKDCTKAVELDDKYIKAYIRRAQSYESTEKFDECLADYKKILELDPTHKDALKATIRLPPLIEEKNEKLKQEMFGKLKDLGDMILKPFGLSTNNFNMEQDPESKGYKINFKN